MGTGVTLALGTTKLWFLADIFLALLVLYQGPRHFKWHPAVAGIAALFALTSLWSPDTPAGLLAAFRVLALYSVVRNTPRLRWPYWAGISVVLAVQLVFMATQFGETTRPWGLSMNASVVGQAALVFAAGPAAPIAAVTLGLSMARSAALGLAVYTLLKRTRSSFAIAALAGAVFIATTLNVNPERLGLSHGAHGIVAAVDARVVSVTEGLVDQAPSASPDDPPVCGEVRERVWRWYGYGYHGYCLSTGLQRPHNLLAVSWWEMGIFAVPFWGLVAFGAWKLRNPMVPALLAVGVITEEMFSRPEGFYLVAAAMASQLRPSAAAVPGRIRRLLPWSRSHPQASASRV